MTPAHANCRGVTLTYTNWRGETAERTIIPQRVWFGSTEWHTEPQWLLTAIDVEKGAARDFALQSFGAGPAINRIAALNAQIDALTASLAEAQADNAAMKAEWAADLIAAGKKRRAAEASFAEAEELARSMALAADKERKRGEAAEAQGFQRGLREAWRVARARADGNAFDETVFGPGTPNDMAVSIDTALRGACDPVIPFDGWEPAGLSQEQPR